MKITPPPLLARQIKHLLIVCFVSILAGIAYQIMVTDYFDHNAIILGLWMGVGFYLFKSFAVPLIKKRADRFPLLVKILISTMAYSCLIYILVNISSFTIGLIAGRTLSEFFSSLFFISQLYLIGYSLIVFSILIFISHVSSLLGKSVLTNLLLGRYHKPVQEERIFMFLDLCSSTEIAEKLDPFEYSSFLKDFFLDIDSAVIESKGSIIQFVGDETVIVWKVKDGIERNNCVRFFALAKTRIFRKKEYYTNRYGTIPKFKAGAHFGKTVITAVGVTKQEIAYHGDTINTAARIRSECNAFKADLLISAELLSMLENIDFKYNVKSVGITTLKGKKNIIGLFAVKKK